MAAPSTAPPKLRKHKSQQYYVRIPNSLGGGSRWFGRDFEVAQQRYQGFVLDLPKNPRLLIDAKPNSVYAIKGEVSIASRGHKLISDLIDEFVQTRISDLEKISYKNWEYRLQQFKKDFGNREIHSLTSTDLDRFRISLKDFSPYTSNPILNHVAAFLKWCHENDHVAVSFKIGKLKKYRNKPTKSKAVSIEEVRKVIQETAKVNKQTARCMLLQFLCTLRPSEVPRVIWHEEPVRDGVIYIHSKTTNKTGALRPVLITPETDELIREIREGAKEGVRCRTLSSYQLSCRRYGKCGPHFLRHSSAQALSDAGVREEFIRVAMGRTKARVDRVYVARENFTEALAAVSVLNKVINVLI